MSDPGDCGCCSGTTIGTPAAKYNRPGLPAIGYRVGSHAEFKATLLARLSSTDYPALGGLTTRDDGDYTIALCDAAAVLGDVLTFYQERIANESYLRTATETRSVTELGRLIGYRLSPGVAAGTALAFTLEEAPGAPALAARPVEVPAGTRAQSVPDPGQDPQTFETVAPITARVGWNAIPPQRSAPPAIGAGLAELHVAGTTTQLQPGDAILVVGIQREKNATSDQWELRLIERVDVDLARGITRVGWTVPLAKPPVAQAAGEGARVFALRQRAALFGYNAPEPTLILTDKNSGLFTTVGLDLVWNNFTNDGSGSKIDLDASYPKIVPGGWFLLDGGGHRQLYRVATATQVVRTAFGLSSRITRLKSDHATDLDQFPLRETLVLAQSEELTIVARPLAYPVYGSELALDRREPDLAPGQLVAVAGKRQRIVVGADTSDVGFEQPQSRVPKTGESFVLAAAPDLVTVSGVTPLDPHQLDNVAALDGQLRLQVEDHDGSVVILLGDPAQLHLQPALKDDPVLGEVATIAPGAGGVGTDLARTTLTLAVPLQRVYDRATVAINANVAPATHGETVREIVGSGDAARSHQRFALKQAPLTYVSTPSEPSGRAAAIELRVNDLAWREVPTLYGRGPLERVFVLRQDHEGRSTVVTGDGVNGACPPSGQNNIRAAYRKGLGSAGNLRAGQLSMLLTRPLGVTSVVNPSPATGGQDAGTVSDAKRDGPLGTLTLGRAVSPRDYADFARTFAGVAKAHAVWIASGRARGMHVTVAGTKGASIPAGSDTFKSLAGALRRFGDPVLPLNVRSYGAPRFRVEARVKPAPDADVAIVLPAVEATLRTAFGFEARAFGQGVSIDDVYGAIHGVPGVLAAQVLKLYRTDLGMAASEPQPRLFAELPAVAADGTVGAAELLTIDPGPIELGVMP
jgi:hypothetical protein